MILVSACLAGVKCRYDGEHRLVENIRQLTTTGRAMPLCPEVLGGRPIPREPVEITGGTGVDVLDGRAKVVDKNGGDHTQEILDGVTEFIKAVKRMNVTAVIMKTKSPACGAGRVYDGTFTGLLIDGDGVLTAALKREGIKIYTEENREEIFLNGN
ncbi:MAG: DUF523 domain-containing protein [Spirochaetia bacterium]|nr:DUF523 domain-containing protein [Spirochaetia bacterium]